MLSTNPFLFSLTIFVGVLVAGIALGLIASVRR